MALLGRVEPGTTYWETVFPALLVLGLGLSLTVAPLTATVLGAVEDSHAGIASAINNSVARHRRPARPSPCSRPRPG